MSVSGKTVLKQLTLNFGQKPSTNSQCSECALFFNPKDKEDVALHHKYHSERHAALRFPASKVENVVQTYDDGRVVVIEPGLSNKSIVNRAIAVLQYVDEKLGIGNESSAMPTSGKLYLFVAASRVQGFCMAEEVKTAHRVQFNSKGTCSCDTSQPPEKVKCGIARIWVSEESRRRGIARRLLDCVRLNFLYFESLQLKHIAFSDPTQFGQKLAKAYFRTETFLVYDGQSLN